MKMLNIPSNPINVRGLLDQICVIFLYKLIKLKEQQIKLNKKILIRFSSIFSKYLRKKKERVNKL